MKREEAEAIAVRALGWLAADPELCGVFMGSTGASVEDLRSLASDPAFLGGVLDFLTMDDRWVTAFCDAETLPYDTPMRARAALPGGEAVHWT